MMDKVSPVEMRKILVLVDTMAKAGIPFVPVPFVTDEQHAELIALCNDRLDEAVRIRGQGNDS